MRNTAVSRFSSRSSSLRLRSLAGAVAAALLAGSIGAAGVHHEARAAASDTAAGRTLYTIVLKGEPLAAYRGELAGYAAPPRKQSGNKAGRIDLQATQSRAYVDHLAQRQSAFVDTLSASIGRPLQPVATMQHALNAVIVELDEREAAIAGRSADVDFVDRERELKPLTDRGPAFIGAPGIWDGTASGGVATQGEGIVVGDLDSGINWESPAFAGVSPLDNYQHVNPNGPGIYLGLCGPAAPNADLGRCNDKLIGMYNFVTTAATRTATDIDGHGSHTASTIAGNHWLAPFGGGTFTISGVAPHANVIAYKICQNDSCGSSASTQAINRAVVDQVDVLNYSISGGTAPWGDSVSVAFRNAVNAGIFVAASAGNGGPDNGSINHIEPWVETVAASTKDNVVAFDFVLTAPGAPPPPETRGLPLRPAAPPLPAVSILNAPIIRSPTFSDGTNDGCSAFPANTFMGLGQPQPDPDSVFRDGFDGPPPPVLTNGVAVLALDQNDSGCGSVARRQAALDAGAIGVIFVDRDFINLGASGTSWSMLRADWDVVWTQIQTDPTHPTASMVLPAASYPQRGDVVSDYSSRGPLASSGQYVIKPDITAPGTDILAVYASNAGGANATAMENGTSMSSPHTTGSAALLRAVHPDWTPSEVRSAINLTSKIAGLIRADGSDVDAWDLGSGRVDLRYAALTGVVLDETGANFAAANPASGGNLSTLNLAQFANGACTATCTFTRTLRSTSLADHTYTLSVTGLPAGAASVAPSVTVPAGATATLTLTVDGTLLAADWNFGSVVLTPDDALLPLLHMPIAVQN